MSVYIGVGSNDQHPNHDVSAGEQYYKDVYEALRSSPQWNQTLFVITYDEHGGFWDHVVPPSENIPAPDDEPSYPDVGYKFDRLGIRIPTLLISPWIKRGTVISAPPAEAKPYDNSEFELTSIIASARKLLGLDVKPLTRRDEWSATFDYALNELTEPRTDCPLHLPDAIPSILPDAGAALTDLQLDIALMHSRLTGEPAVTPETSAVDHAQWLSEQYQLHHARTMRWRQSKQTSYEVIIQPSAWYATYRVFDHSWHLNGISHGETVETAPGVPYITLSTQHLRTDSTSTQADDSVPYCLDAGTGVEGSPIQVSACYPSEKPTDNRDVFQHFVLHPDGALQFYDPLADTPLCVTNHDPQVVTKSNGTNTDVSVGDLGLSLQRCVRKVEQNWAYHGVAPGEGDTSGNMEFGDIEYYLGVVLKDSV